MNMQEFSINNGDFMGASDSANEASEVQHQERLLSASSNFFYDCEHGRAEQISRVIRGRSFTLASELRDYIDEAALFHLLQKAMRGEDVGQTARDLVDKAAGAFAEATTE